MKEFVEKLISMLEEEHEICINRYGIVGGNVPASIVKRCIEIVKDLAEEHNNGWIPCSEILPDDSQTVIFTAEDGMVESGWYDAKKNWCVNESYFPGAFKFIAWQPLPAPYKKGE